MSDDPNILFSNACYYVRVDVVYGKGPMVRIYKRARKTKLGSTERQEVRLPLRILQKITEEIQKWTRERYKGT